MCYEMNLQQIRNAVLESVYIGVLEAFLRCKMHAEIWMQKYGRGGVSFAQWQRVANEEVEQWACIQKVEHGFDLLDSRVKRKMRALGVNPNMWILPEGVKPYLAQVRKENFSIAKGAAGQAMYNSALNAGNVKQLDVQNDCAIFEVRFFGALSAPKKLTEPAEAVCAFNQLYNSFILCCCFR